jgi:hypothetical protein
MQHAHDKGILHRDLKPANVLMNARDEPVVTDFGLAFRLDSDTSERLTEQGLLVGTPSYMPPEQINAQELGPTADVYSLGMVLYELLTGSVAFQAPLGKLLAQIETAAPAPPSQLRPGLSPMLDATCLKALAKRPQDRFASMAELAGALEDYAAGRERLDLLTETLVFRRPRGRRKWLALAAAVLCVVLAALAFLWIRLQRPAEDRGASAASAAPASDTAVKLLFVQMQRQLLNIEAVATDHAPVRLARAMIPQELLLQPVAEKPDPAGAKRQLDSAKPKFQHHDGPLNFLVSGSGKGHIVNLTDQVGQDIQLTNFSAGDITVQGQSICFVDKLGDGVQVFVQGGPGYSILAPLQNGRGSRHIEFDGTHLLCSKVETPAIETGDANAPELSALRNPKLTRKLTFRYSACDYVIYTSSDVIVVPGDHQERRTKFPEIYNLIELDRLRQFKARIITAEQLQRAIDDGKKN